MDSKRRLEAKKLCYAEPARSSWPLKQGRMGDLSQLKEVLEQKITTWQRKVDLKLMKSLWGAHVRTPEEDDLSEECVCEPPRACLCCHRPPEMVERALLYAYQGLKDTTKGEESVEDHLRTSTTQGASNLHSDENMEDKIKLLEPRVRKLIKTYPEVFGELPPPAACLGGSSCMVKKDGKGREMKGFQRRQIIVVWIDISGPSRTTMAKWIFL